MSRGEGNVYERTEIDRRTGKERKNRVSGLQGQKAQNAALEVRKKGLASFG